MNLKNIPGIGDKTILNLNKLNIYNINDLIEYYPYKYNFYNPVDINNIDDLNTITINATIESIPKIIYIKRNFNYLTFRAITSNKLINVTIFNRSFMKNNLTIGKDICLIGKYDKEKNKFTATNILLNSLTNSIIEPIYHLKGTIKNKQINNLITNTLNNTNITNTLPEYLINKYNFLNINNSLKW